MLVYPSQKTLVFSPMFTLVKEANVHHTTPLEFLHSALQLVSIKICQTLWRFEIFLAYVPKWLKNMGSKWHWMPQCPWLKLITMLLWFFTFYMHVHLYLAFKVYVILWIFGHICLVELWKTLQLLLNFLTLWFIQQSIQHCSSSLFTFIFFFIFLLINTLDS